MQETSAERSERIRKQPASGPPGEEEKTKRGRRRESTRRGTASTSSGPGSEDGREGIQASAEPDEGGQVSLRPSTF
jgi:hypothetical protein